MLLRITLTIAQYAFKLDLLRSQMSNFKVPSSGCLRTCCKSIIAKEIFAKLDGSFILAPSAIRLITVIPACLLGLTQVKVTLKSRIQPAQTCWTLICEFNWNSIFWWSFDNVNYAYSEASFNSVSKLKNFQAWNLLENINFKQ